MLFSSYFSLEVLVCEHYRTESNFWKPEWSLNINGSNITADYQPYQPSQIYCGRLVLCGNKNLNYCLFKEPKENISEGLKSITQKKCGSKDRVVPPGVCEPRGGGSCCSAAGSYCGPNCPSALCGGSKPQDDKLALSWWVEEGGEMFPMTRQGAGLRSASLC